MNDDPSGDENSSWIDNLIQSWTGKPRTRNELIELLRNAQERNLLDCEVLSIIEGALQVNDIKAREIMVPRSSMVVIEDKQTPEEFLPKIIETGHSRYPVIGSSLDDVRGILMAKDLLRLALKGSNKFNLKDMLRPATVIPESKRVNALLQEFRSTHNHMAVVVDEYGGVSGLVTIEDVLEQIVGEIEDEFDIEDDANIRQFSDNDFIVKALTPIDEFNECFQTTFSGEEFDTIGGIVMQGFGYLPMRDETIEIDRLQFKVVNADNRRIRLLRITENDQQDAVVQKKDIDAA